MTDYNHQTRLATLGTRMAELNDDPDGQATYYKGHPDDPIVTTLTLTVCLEKDAPLEMMPGLVVTRVEHQNFICTYSDIGFLPEPGHHIKRAGGQLYQVAGSDDEDMPVWEFTTSNEDRIRIRTVEVRAA